MKRAVLIVLLAACCASLVLGGPQTTECPDRCTQEYRPICGKNKDGISRDFPNKCAMTVHNCKNPDKAFDYPC